jgi:type IV secretory pathway TrbD component
MSEYIAGYHADIHMAIWHRPTTMGAPRIWSQVWLVLCLYVGLMTLFLVGVSWLLLPLVAWALGQGALIALTQFDPAWDDIALAHLGRRYHLYYAAG